MMMDIEVMKLKKTNTCYNYKLIILMIKGACG